MLSDSGEKLGQLGASLKLGQADPVVVELPLSLGRACLDRLQRC
jgi:hypothetical protein